MKSEQEDTHGLPTALEVKEKVSIGAEFEPTDYFKDEVVEGDELVRLKDVKQLIQDKIEQENDFEDIKMANNPVTAKLEELLEEIEQSDVEKKGGEQ